VATGQVVVVLGPSARVRSTLCRAINRLEPVRRRRYQVDDRPLPAEGKQLAQLRADVAWVPEFQPFRAQDDSWKTSPSPR